MGIFSNGPLSPEELQANPVVLYPNPPEPKKPCRNTTVIRATRVADGYRWEFRGWAEVERLGFDRMAILSSMSPQPGHDYKPSNRPYDGFRWEILPPQDHEIPPDSYMQTY